MSNPTPSHATIYDLAFAKRAASIRVALPGRIESYNASTQKANVQPLILEEHTDDIGERQIERLPVVTDVPVCFPGCGGMRVTFPVKVGDTVLLVFCSSSIDRWLARGGEVDPEDTRHHNISDAIALPGLFDFAHVPTSAPTDALVLHSTKIQLGADDASDPVARKSDLQAIVNALDTHAHTGVTTGAGTSGPPASAFTTPNCSSVVSSK